MAETARSGICYSKRFYTVDFTSPNAGKFASSEMRKCPSCNHKVSFWRVIKPAIFDSSHKQEVVCQKCSHVISRAWSDIGCWFGLVELAFPIILWQLDMSFKLFFSALVSFALGTLLLAYLFIPFSDYGKQKK
jgi:hypothetical protein